MMKTVKFYTLGCKVNQYDTQTIRERFLKKRFKEWEDGSPADIYVINTCTVTQRADSESFGFIRQAKRENSKAQIIVTGCLTELDEDRIKKINGVYLIVKNKDKNRILEFLSENNELNEPNQQTSLTHNGISYFKGHTRAFLKIQDGCNNFCSYCKVPLVRGSSRSKPKELIIEEADRLVNYGYKEIVLCGICLGAYGKDLDPQINLVDIIVALEKMDGLLRIRLSSIEANDVTDDLINKMAVSKKFCRHLHIPLQSADDQILKQMNRKYCRQDYLNLIKKIKSRIPEVAITTDVLVGFPNEDEVKFQNTLDLIKEVAPLRVHIFAYSKREGTKAFNFKNEVKPAIIKQRISRLKSIAYVCAINYKKQFINKNMDVLMEQRLKENSLFWQGYADNYIKVLVKSERNLKNQLISVRLNQIDNDYLRGDFS